MWNLNWINLTKYTTIVLPLVSSLTSEELHYAEISLLLRALMTVNRSSLKYHKVTFLLHHLGVHPPSNVSCCIVQVPSQPSLDQACWSNPYEIPQLTFWCLILLLFRLCLEPQYVNHFKICLSIMNFIFLSNVIELVALNWWD